MSKILYYSNYCDNCKKLLSNLSKSNVKQDIHFICIDKRIKRDNKTYVVLEDSKQIILPNTIVSVPSLLLLNDNYRVVSGDNVYKLIEPIIQEKNHVACNFNGEPDAFMLASGNDNVSSDNYSFLDQGTDDLSTRGNGGMRQMHNYASIGFLEKINTPPDEYTPDKVGEGDIEQLQKSRNN